MRRTCPLPPPSKARGWSGERQLKFLAAAPTARPKVPMRRLGSCRPSASPEKNRHTPMERSRIAGCSILLNQPMNCEANGQVECVLFVRRRCLLLDRRSPMKKTKASGKAPGSEVRCQAPIVGRHPHQVHSARTPILAASFLTSFAVAASVFSISPRFGLAWSH